MSTSSEDGDDNIVSLAKTISKKREKVTEELSDILFEAYNDGVGQLQEVIENASEGFFAIVFDGEGQPNILWAGQLDELKTLGAIDYAKTLFTNQTIGPATTGFDD